MSNCQLFEEIASDVWDIISRNRARGRRSKEIRLTDGSVIDKIQNYVEDNDYFQVFAQDMRLERDRGGDLEIYVQTDRDQFVRLLIQAKVIEKNGRLDDLDRESGNTGRKQYDTLINYGARINSPTFYLIYNGIPNFHEKFTDCAGYHTEEQFGCALVSSSMIKDYCDNNNTGSLSGIINKRPLGRPWRFLTCCENEFDPRVIETYSKREIDMDSSFDNIFTPPQPIGFINSNRMFEKEEKELLNDSIHRKGWNPYSRLFISKYKMYKSDELLKFRL